jgi:hypothetical protein
MSSVVFAAVIATIVTALYARYKFGGVQRDWEAILSQDARRMIDEVRARMIVEAAMADDALLGAQAARAAGDWREACRLLDLGVWALDQAMPSRLTRLHGIATAVRVATAIAPPPPVPAARFQIPILRGLAGVGTVIHHVLVTPTERMLLRLWLISCAFRFALRIVRRAASVLRRHPEAACEWARFAAGRADWATADEEHLASFRLLLEGVAVTDRAEILAR